MKKWKEAGGKNLPPAPSYVKIFFDNSLVVFPSTCYRIYVCVFVVLCCCSTQVGAV